MSHFQADPKMSDLSLWTGLGAGDRVLFLLMRHSGKRVAMEDSYEVVPFKGAFDEKVFPGVKGDTAQFRTRVSASVVEEIAQMIASRNIHPEIMTTGHFVRDAIIHRLNYWRGMISDKDLANRIEATIAVDELAHEEERYERVIAEIASIERQLDRAWKEDDIIYVHTLLQKAVKVGNNLHVPHLREKMGEVVGKHYKKLKERNS